MIVRPPYEERVGTTQDAPTPHLRTCVRVILSEIIIDHHTLRPEAPLRQIAVFS